MRAKEQAMKYLILFVLVIFCAQLFSTDPYFGPGQKYASFDAAFANAKTSDQIIDGLDVDIKILPGNHWSWVSFPRLNRTQNGLANACTVLSELGEFLNGMDLIHNYNNVLEYSINWNPARYDIRSDQGFKLNQYKAGLRELKIEGSQLPMDWKITSTLPADFPNWMGYWIPYTQNIKDAFGDFFYNVFAVEAEDWFYISSDIKSPSSSTIGKNFEYGKGYIIYFEEPIKNFYWNDSKREITIIENPEPKHFNVRQLPNYEIIDIMAIPENALEIGVFVDDVCYGAKTVQDVNEQILVYSSNANRDEFPFVFKIISNTEQKDSISIVAIYNKDSCQFEKRELLTGKQRYSIIKLESNDPSIKDVSVISEFKIKADNSDSVNQENTVHFTLQKQQEIEIAIYDVNGRLVRKLFKGSITTGSHSTTWDGNDANGQPASSGIYICRLIVNNVELTRKMMIIK